MCSDIFRPLVGSKGAITPRDSQLDPSLWAVWSLDYAALSLGTNRTSTQRSNNTLQANHQNYF